MSFPNITLLNSLEDPLGEAVNPHLDTLAKGFKVVTLEEFLGMEFPPQEDILGSWLRKRSLNMVYAWRGVGKTMFVLNIAFAVASGCEFLGWKATKPRGVLYLDGEMPANSIQERLAKIAISQESDFPEENFRLCTIDLQQSSMPDLGTKEGQEAVDEMIMPTTELIIIDNISCLVRSGGKENDAESWLSIAEWAMAKRSQGLAIIFVHHAAKGGQQRGTSKREDVLDTVISLKHAADYDEKMGACFNVHFEKSRHLCGEAVEPFTAKLVQDDLHQTWEKVSLLESNKVKIIGLHKDGLTKSEIANELGLDRSTVYRALKKAEDSGEISSLTKRRKNND